MRFATYQTNAGGSGAGGGRGGAADGRDGAAAAPVRFGDELLVFADDAGWPAASARAESSGLEPKGPSGEFAEEEPYLVVQVGNSFRSEHPDVPVLLNKGRYLAVALKPERARRLAEEKSCCFTVRPLEAGEVVFDVRRPSAERAPADDWVKALVSGLSRPSVEASLTFLTSFPTRLSTGPHYAEAAEWAAKQLTALGYGTRRQKINVGGGKSQNVIAERRGGGPGSRGVVLVTAHLDSVNVEGGDAAPAPGADDNASGAAGLLEIARVLKDHAGVQDLRFILFGGEEQGLHGSQQYVASLSAAERGRIRAVVNMDMVATLNTERPAVLLEGANVSQAVIDGLAAAAAAHT
ncbi:MAG TPA: M20/M25/M40 family metallo-hydrolase, partial [Pyrinomonadaceae bacterium]|nr:M20/M25/M40 family metallo-hydrolase [Pyrinomonadaceae bacterium]